MAETTAGPWAHAFANDLVEHYAAENKPLYQTAYEAALRAKRGTRHAAARVPMPEPPKGGWKPGLPKVDTLPILAWVGWWMESHGICEEDGVAAALVTLAGIASGQHPGEPAFLAFVVENAARQYTEENHDG